MILGDGRHFLVRKTNEEKWTVLTSTGGYCRTERNGGINTAKIIDSLQSNCAQWACHFLVQVPPSSIKWSLYLLPFILQGDVEGTQEQYRVKVLGNSVGY